MGVSINQLPISVANVAELVQTKTVDKGIIQAAAYHADGEGGGGAFEYRATGRSAVTPNGGTIIAGTGSDDYYNRPFYGRIINVKDFGAYGDYTGAGNDDTAAIQAAADAAYLLASPVVAEAGTVYNHPTLYFPPAEGYKITDTITVKAGIHVKMDDRLVMVGDVAKTALVIGEAGAYNFSASMDLRLARDAVLPGGVDESDIGVEIINAYYCDIHLRNIWRFSVNAKCHGTNSLGFVYNTTRIGALRGAYIHLEGVGTNGGWCNENLWIGGEFSGGQLDSQNQFYGVKLWNDGKTVTRIDNNYFLKPSFELNPPSGKRAFCFWADYCTGLSVEKCRIEESVDGGTRAALFTGDSRENEIYVAAGSDVTTFVDQSLRKTNIVYFMRDLWNWHGKRIYQTQNIGKRANFYNSTDIFVPGLTPCTTTDTTIRKSLDALNFSTDGMNVPGSRGIGRIVDCRVAKKFIITADCDSRFVLWVRAFDKDLTVLPATDRNFLQTVTPDNATNTFTYNSHGLSDGTPMQFLGQDLPTGIKHEPIYYVVNATTNTWQVSETVGGAAVTFTDDGSSVQAFVPRYAAFPGVYTSGNIYRGSFVYAALVTMSDEVSYAGFYISECENLSGFAIDCVEEFEPHAGTFAGYEERYEGMGLATTAPVDGEYLANHVVYNDSWSDGEPLGWVADNDTTSVEVTPNATTDVFEATSHGLSNGTKVRLWGTDLPSVTGTPVFTMNVAYYVVNANANDFQLSGSLGGAAITFDAVGSGYMRVYVPNTTTWSELPGRYRSWGNYLTYFDGTNDYVDTGSQIDLSGNTITISCKILATQHTRVIVAQGGNGSGYMMYVNANGQIEIALKQSALSTATHYAARGGTNVLNKLVLVEATIDYSGADPSVTITVDGVAESITEVVAKTATYGDRTQNVVWGARDGGASLFHTGYIYDPYITNGSVTYDKPGQTATADDTTGWGSAATVSGATSTFRKGAAI